MNGFASLLLADAPFSLQIFWIIGILGLALIILQGIVGLIIGHHGDVSSDTSSDSGSHGGFAAYLSLRSIAAILLGFGFGGAYLDRIGLAIGLAALGGLCIGMMVGVLYVALVSSLGRLRSEGHRFELMDAVSRTGTVYLPIPGESAGCGEVQVAFGGRVNNLPAFTEGAPLPVGTFVRIIGLHGEKAVRVEKAQNI